MAVQLNHTIVPSRDKRVAATFLAEILGLAEPKSFGPFLAVAVANDVTLDFADWDGGGKGEIPRQHYAFLVGEAEFDEIFGRIQARNLDYWADPHHDLPGEINRRDGGRGCYFDDPDGHILEILTRPYGSAG